MKYLELQIWLQPIEQVSQDPAGTKLPIACLGVFARILCTRDTFRKTRKSSCLKFNTCKKCPIKKAAICNSMLFPKPKGNQVLRVAIFGGSLPPFIKLQQENILIFHSSQRPLYICMGNILVVYCYLGSKFSPFPFF